MVKDSYEEIFKNKQTIMVVMAHPDDLEVFCGATVARLLHDGKRVISVKITSGDKGTKNKAISPNDLAAKREREDAAAMQSLGIPQTDSIFLHEEDGAIEDSLETITKIAYLIRKFQPELIITTNPENIIIRREQGVNWINHRDHRNAAACALDAAYPYSRDRAFFTEQFDDPAIKPGNCTEFLIADSWDGTDEVLIDASEFVEAKQAALQCHESQLDAEGAAEYAHSFTTHNNVPGAYEKFRYVIAD
jgi:LmbE family N-acetylglucosaminyl deacetylase